MSIPKPTTSKGEWYYHTWLNQVMAPPLELEEDPLSPGMVLPEKNQNQNNKMVPHKLGKKEGMAVGRKSVVASLPIFLVLVT